MFFFLLVISWFSPSPGAINALKKKKKKKTKAVDVARKFTDEVHKPTKRTFI